MKVKMFNKSQTNKFVDLVGRNNPDDIIVLGPKASTIVDIPSETRFVSLSKKHRNKVIIRKL